MSNKNSRLRFKYRWSKLLFFYFVIIMGIACAKVAEIEPENTPLPLVYNTREVTSTPQTTITREAANTPISTPVLSTTVPKNLYFSLDKINNEIPDDIREEVLYFGGGGGSICGDPSKTGLFIYIPEVLNPDFIFRHISDSVFAPGTSIPIIICKGPENGDFTLTITKPNEEVFLYQGTLDYGGIFYYFYHTNWEDPAGVYEVKVSTSNSIVSATAYWNLEQPQSPVAHLTHDNQLNIYNLQKNEHVRIVLYGLDVNSIKSGTGIPSGFLGWKEFNADQDGHVSLILDVQNHPTNLAIIGDISGEVPYANNYQESALRIFVIAQKDIFIRTNESYWNRGIGDIYVAAGTRMELIQIAKPYGEFLAFVSLDNNSAGWVRPEEVRSTYILKVIRENVQLNSNDALKCSSMEPITSLPSGTILFPNISIEIDEHFAKVSGLPHYCPEDGEKYWYVTDSSGSSGWVKYDDVEIISK